MSAISLRINPELWLKEATETKASLEALVLDESVEKTKAGFILLKRGLALVAQFDQSLIKGDFTPLFRNMLFLKSAILQFTSMQWKVLSSLSLRNLGFMQPRIEEKMSLDQKIHAVQSITFALNLLTVYHTSPRLKSDPSLGLTTILLQAKVSFMQTLLKPLLPL